MAIKIKILEKKKKRPRARLPRILVTGDCERGGKMPPVRFLGWIGSRME